MSLPEHFRFSQAALQDFVDCRRRFELRYLERLAWPALETEPALEHERRMKLGAQFHALVQQHTAGVPADRIEASIRDAELLGWWRSYLAHPVPDLPDLRRAEITMTAPLAGHRLTAKFDLLAYEPGGRIVIVDWKTGQSAPSRARLAERLQTRVYRYVAVEAGTALNGGAPVDPAQVSLIYWFVSEPGSPVVFSYSRLEHEAEGQALSAMIQEIEAQQRGEFPLTEDERKCAYCVYRSLCARGEQPGDIAGLPQEEIEDWDDLDFDIDQVGETVF